MIKREKEKYVVIAELGRRMGTYKTKKEAEHRLKQIEYFKHLRKSPRMKKQLRKKTLLKK